MSPVCACHGEPMYWHRFTNRPAGGYWRCRIVKRAVDRQQWTKAVRVGRAYFGRVATAEQAAEINARGRVMLADFKNAQKEELDAARP